VQKDLARNILPGWRNHRIRVGVILGSGDQEKSAPKPFGAQTKEFAFIYYQD
jgi:hypothetical protein